MKKILFVLTALTLPLTAKAEIQLAPEKMPEATVQAAIKDFVDPWCKTGFDGLIENVQQCFKETPEDSPNIDKCIIGHYLLVGVTKALHDNSIKKGSDDPTLGISYVTRQKSHDRGIYYINLPRYKNINVSNYFSSVGKTVSQKITKCPSN